ncbi:MAG: hypothetical protein K2N31_09855 [Treponemataceae bacterium]|nr:hypothetical protein [Treponemataceae bacterium]
MRYGKMQKPTKQRVDKKSAVVSRQKSIENIFRGQYRLQTIVLQNEVGITCRNFILQISVECLPVIQAADFR